MNFIETNNSILIASIIKNKDKWQICLRSKITDCVAKSQENDNFTTIISIYQKVIELDPQNAAAAEYFKQKE